MDTLIVLIALGASALAYAMALIYLLRKWIIGIKLGLIHHILIGIILLTIPGYICVLIALVFQP